MKTYIANTKIKNIGLKKDLQEMLENPDNILKIEKGEMSGNSIEVWFKEPATFTSNTYYDKEALRDADYEHLMKHIEESKKQ